MSSNEVVIVSREGKPKAILVLARAGEKAPVLPHAVVGQMATLGADATPDWATFQRNTAFVEFYVRFMRGELPIKPDILTDVRANPGDYVYVVDARTKHEGGNVPFEETVGWYRARGDGAPAPETFVYNDEHSLVTMKGELSSILLDAKLQKAALAPMPTRSAS